MLGGKGGEKVLRGVPAQTSPAHSIPWAVPRGVAIGVPWAMFQEHGPGVRGICGCPF